MHKLKIIAFSLITITLFSLSIDVNACTSLLLSPEAICEENNPTFTKGFEHCYVELLDLPEEEYRNNYDQCLNLSKQVQEIRLINKNTVKYIYLDLLRQKYIREKGISPVILLNLDFGYEIKNSIE